jgi:hypothetical protein
MTYLVESVDFLSHRTLMARPAAISQSAALIRRIILECSRFTLRYITLYISR